MRIAPHYFTDVRKTIIKIAWIILLSSCLSPIDLPTENAGNRLVVSGQVSPIADQNYVQLGRTADTDRLPFPVTGAFVQLLDDVGNEFNYEEDEFNPGMYFLKDFSGVPSIQYFIRIWTPEGETYESTPETMPEDAGTVTAYFDVQREETTDIEGAVTEKPFIKIYSNALLPSVPGNGTSTKPSFFRQLIFRIHLAQCRRPATLFKTQIPKELVYLMEKKSKQRLLKDFS
jgi:hypothetical protein